MYTISKMSGSNDKVLCKLAAALLHPKTRNRHARELVRWGDRTVAARISRLGERNADRLHV